MDTKNIFKKKGRKIRMKIKKTYILGILLLVLIMSLAACGDKDVVDDGEMGTPEGVIIAYLNGFSEEDFTQIESMLEEEAIVGDVYYTQTQQPPKNTLAMIESQHEFITHFYGNEAWTSVEYQLEEIATGDDGAMENDSMTNPDSEVGNEAASDIDPETGAIKEYRVNFIFNETPRHLMGFENIHILLSNESGAWLIKEGLSWDKNLYGGGPAPEYFKGSEAMYRGVNGDLQPDDVIGMLGQPVAQDQSDEEGFLSYYLEYNDASYYFAGVLDEDEEFDRYYLESIMINSGNYSLPRNIKLGDTFFNTMEKFPRDKDWLEDLYNCFYGINTLEGFGGACFTYDDEDANTYDSIILVPTEYVPYLKLEFTNKILQSAMIVFVHMQ